MLTTNQWDGVELPMFCVVKNIVYIKTFNLILLILFFALSSSAQSQDSFKEPVVLPEVLVEGDSEKTDYVVEDSTTATKFKVPIKDTPSSIQVIDRVLIDDQRAERLQDTVYNVSGLVPGDSTINPFLVRGFRAEVLRDGYVSSSSLVVNFFNEDLTNVERIEFLKGPASILYGNVAAGGTINIMTKQPLSEFYSSVDGTIGSYEFYRGAVDISAPLTKDDNLFLRFNGSYRHSNSFRDFITSERIALAPELLWIVSPGVRVSLDAEYFYIDEPFDDGIVAVGDRVANIPFSRNLGEPTDETKLKYFLVKGIVESELTSNLRMINAFRYYRNSGLRDDVFSVALLPDNRTLVRAIFDSPVFEDNIYTFKNDLFVDYQTVGFNHEFLFGIEYIRQNLINSGRFPLTNNIDIFDPIYNQGQPIDPSTPTVERTVDIDNIGLYIQDFISFDKRLFILAGLRFDYLNQFVSDDVLTPGIAVTTQNKNYEFSPRVGALFWLADFMSTYVNYSESFNSYAVTSFTADGDFLNPEKTWQIEGGVKFAFLNDSLLSTVSIYRITKKNALTTDPINGAVFAVQVKEERSQGFEFDLSTNPYPGLNFIASYSFIDAEVVKDNFFPSGNRLAAVPKNSGSFWGTYRIYKGPLNGFGLGAGFIGVGKRDGDLDNTFKLEGFVRIDAAFYFEREFSDSINIKASVNFKNITDKEYIVTSDSRLRVYPGAPFNVLANLKVEFF